MAERMSEADDFFVFEERGRSKVGRKTESTFIGFHLKFEKKELVVSFSNRCSNNPFESIKKTVPVVVILKVPNDFTTYCHE